MIDLGPSEKETKLTYVALSRISNISDLILEPTTLDKLNLVKLRRNFYYRCKKEARLKILQTLQHWTTTQNHKLMNSQNCI